MKPKYRYNKHVRWATRELLLELAKHIDDNNLIDIDVAEEIKAYARQEMNKTPVKFTWER